MKAKRICESPIRFHTNYTELCVTDEYQLKASLETRKKVSKSWDETQAKASCSVSNFKEITSIEAGLNVLASLVL